MSTVLTRSSAVTYAARRLSEAETALHAARQSHVDFWIMAASDKLHEAVVAYVAALNEPKRSGSILAQHVAEADVSTDHRA